MSNHSRTIGVLYGMAQRAGGVSSAEASAAIGMPVTELATRLGWMVATGRARREKVSEGRVTSRYYADPSRTLHDVELALAKLRKPRKDRGRPKAAPVAKHKPGKALTVMPPKLMPIAPRGGLQGKVIMPPGLVVTQCPSNRDTRYTPDGSAVPMFSCMAPGSYLPSDTWAARAYA